MVVRITRALLLIQFLSASLIALILWGGGRNHAAWTAILIGGSIILLLRFLIACNNFYFSRRFGSETPLTHCISWVAAVRLFSIEFFASMKSSSYTLPF